MSEASPAAPRRWRAALPRSRSSSAGFTVSASSAPTRPSRWCSSPRARPLPEILRDDEINKLLSVSRDMLWDRLKPDARPYLLVSLLVQTGMKKAEVARLLLADLDAGQPNAPEVTIRYADEAHAHKNRTLGLHPSILPVLNQYKEQYKPVEFLFDCTPRNLEYVLRGSGRPCRHQAAAGWLRVAALDGGSARLSHGDARRAPAPEDGA